MDNENTSADIPDELPLWFHDGLYGKIKATAINNYYGAIVPDTWYTFHYLPNGNFWLYRLDEATDEQTARIQSGTMAREGDYPVVRTEVFKCTSAPTPDHVVVHHTPTDTTRPVLLVIENKLGLTVKFIH